MSVINTNVRSLIAQNALTVNNRTLDKAMQQLSTGKRINSAADDAAGLAIAEHLRRSSRMRPIGGGLATAPGAAFSLVLAPARPRDGRRGRAARPALGTGRQSHRDARRVVACATTAARSGAGLRRAGAAGAARRTFGRTIAPRCGRIVRTARRTDPHEHRAHRRT